MAKTSQDNIGEQYLCTVDGTLTVSDEDKT